MVEVLVGRVEGAVGEANGLGEPSPAIGVVGGGLAWEAGAGPALTIPPVLEYSCGS